MGEDDDDALSTSKCPGDKRIVIMIPILLVSFFTCFLVCILVFISHRRSHRKFGGQHNLEAAASADGENAARENSADSSNEQDNDAEAKPDHADEQIGENSLRASAKFEMFEAYESHYHFDENWRFLSKLLALSVGFGATTLSITAFALTLKALPLDTRDATSSNFCSSGVIGVAVCLTAVNAVVASVSLVATVRFIGKELLDDI